MAPSDIYSYRHPCSLHVSLPISRRRLVHFCLSSCLKNRCLDDVDAALAIDQIDQPASVERHVVRGGALEALRRIRLEIADLLRGERIGHIDETKPLRSEEHTSELQSLMRISYAVFCLKKT